jgi:acetyl esterase
VSERQHTTLDTTAPGPHGAVPVRLYLPAMPAGIGLVWIHGGAFRMGDLDVPEAHWVSGRLADRGVTVVSVDYRLAVGGVHFPIPSDDCIAAWRWAVNTSRLTVTPGRWYVGGGSAGGNLAASVALQARDGVAPLPAGSVLVYPVLHEEVPPPSAELARKLDRAPADRRFPRDQSRELNIGYVGRAEFLTHPYAFPALGESTGLPPTLIINSDVDDLRPSGEAYAAQLAGSGVDVTVVREPGALHGHLNETAAPAARRTVDRIHAWLTQDLLQGDVHERAAGVAAGNDGHRSGDTAGSGQPHYVEWRDQAAAR